MKKQKQSSKSTGTEKSLIGKTIRELLCVHANVINSEDTDPKEVHISLNIDIKFKAFNKHEISFTVVNHLTMDTRSFATLSRACDEYEKATKVLD